MPNFIPAKPLLSQQQIQQVIGLAEETAAIIMHYYTDGIDVSLKKDSSPVTQADLAASERLEATLPQIAAYPVLSEENVPKHHEWLNWETYWMIDPIDGTKHFINQTGDFCICIALIHQNRAVFGLIYAPVSNTAWFAQHMPQSTNDTQVFRYHQQTTQAIYTKPPKLITATLSAKKLTDNMQRLLENLPDYQWYSRGSALKYIDIVEGQASLYPKMWDTCEWDSAAGQCILECSGGQVINLNDGTALQYGNKTSLLNAHFLAYHSLNAEHIEQLLVAYQKIHS